MSLKELTKHKHQQAESTKFMQAVFDKKMPLSVWGDFLYQKYLIYNAIESSAKSFNLLQGIETIQRAELILEDYQKLDPNNLVVSKAVTNNYVNYINSLESADEVLAHLYTWHLGDMYGGQMISKIINAPSKHLEFEDTRLLIDKLRQKLNDNMADEANNAFDWAINLMSEYDWDLVE